LLVDGHDEARQALAERLRRDGRIEFLGAARDVEGATLLLSTARPDVILLDIHGSDGGVQDCRVLRGATEALIVIFASFMTPERWSAARQVGAGGYLLKHIGSELLGSEIVRLAETQGRATTGPGQAHRNGD
jgi:DNA-binding NarL/FixJ family response regulator